MLPQFPLTTRDTIEEIISQIGRDIDFYTVVSVSGCPDCNLNQLTDTSTDSFCETCSGVYWIPTYSGSTMEAHITWGQLDDKSWQTGGMIDNGECTVKVMHDADREEIVNNTEYVVVDGREMDVVNIILRGAPEINRILVKLKEKER
jgi:hypothetical protein